MSTKNCQIEEKRHTRELLLVLLLFRLDLNVSVQNDFVNTFVKFKIINKYLLIRNFKIIT